MRVAILLAAGASRRFGRADKLLAPICGVPMVVRALGIAEAAPAQRLLVAVSMRGPRASLLRRAAGRRVEIVRVARAEQGLSASLRTALLRLRPIDRAVFVFLGDMPAVPEGLAKRLARQRAPARAHHRGRPGHPVLIARPKCKDIRRLSGDSGLRGLIVGRTTAIEGGPGCVADVDDRAALRRMRLWYRRMARH